MSLAVNHSKSAAAAPSSASAEAGPSRATPAAAASSPVGSQSADSPIGRDDDAGSLELALQKGPQQAQFDASTKPRSKAPRRPIELGLRQLKKDGKADGKGKGRAVPFGAPYPDSGVVLEHGNRSWREWIPPGPLSFGTWQGWYLLLFHAVGATIISGAANFGIACAMYRSQSDITYWILARNTVAGDMGVTVLIQCIITFIITSALVHSDLSTGPVAPLSRPWPPLLHLPSTPAPHGFGFFGMRLPRDVPEGESLRMGPTITSRSSAFKRYFLWIIRMAYTGSERNDLLAPGLAFTQRLERLVCSALQGLLLGVISFPWFWGIAMAITAPLYSARNLGGTWIPEIIKLIYGGLLALFTNPIIALMAMGAESSVKRAYPELDIWEQQPLPSQAGDAQRVGAHSDDDSLYHIQNPSAEV